MLVMPITPMTAAPRPMTTAVWCAAGLAHAGLMLPRMIVRRAVAVLQSMTMTMTTLPVGRPVRASREPPAMISMMPMSGTMKIVAGKTAIAALIVVAGAMMPGGRGEWIVLTA